MDKSITYPIFVYETFLPYVFIKPPEVGPGMRSTKGRFTVDDMNEAFETMKPEGFWNGKVLELVGLKIENGEYKLNDTMDQGKLDEINRTWNISRIDKSWDARNNYENLEYLGDRMYKAVFGEYVFEKFPDLDENNYNDMADKYASKEFQAEMADSFGMREYILTNLPVTMDNLEDVLEGLFGALYTCCNIVLGRGTGYIYCRNLLYNIFERYVDKDDHTYDVTLKNIIQ